MFEYGADFNKNDSEWQIEKKKKKSVKINNKDKFLVGSADNL